MNEISKNNCLNWREQCSTCPRTFQIDPRSAEKEAWTPDYHKVLIKTTVSHVIFQAYCLPSTQERSGTGSRENRFHSWQSWARREILRSRQSMIECLVTPNRLPTRHCWRRRRRRRNLSARPAQNFILRFASPRLARLRFISVNSVASL
jgi:hypothetical protein